MLGESMPVIGCFCDKICVSKLGKQYFVLYVSKLFQTKYYPVEQFKKYLWK